MTRMKWKTLVDITTAIWLLLFIRGLIIPNDKISTYCSQATIILLPIFFYDLYLLYKDERDLRKFIVKRWFDILLVIPYFRIFRILRLARLARLAKLLRFAKLRKKTKRIANGLPLNKKGSK